MPTFCQCIFRWEINFCFFLDIRIMILINTYKFQNYMPNPTAMRLLFAHKGGNRQVQIYTVQKCDTDSKQVNSDSSHAVFRYLSTIELVGKNIDPGTKIWVMALVLLWPLTSHISWEFNFFEPRSSCRKQWLPPDAPTLSWASNDNVYRAIVKMLYYDTLLNASRVENHLCRYFR